MNSTPNKNLLDFPGADNDHLDSWNRNLQGPLSRLLSANGSAHGVGPELLTATLQSGAWALGLADKTENALLAYLANIPFQWQPLAKSYHEGVHMPVEARIQSLLLTLDELGCDPLVGFPEGGADSLDLAVLQNANLLVAKWLPRVPGAFDRLIHGLPYLHVAAGRNNLETIDALLAAGMDVNLKDKDGNTPLFYASHERTVKHLCAVGADRSIINAQGLDARSFWQVNRSIRSAHLASMSTALGKLAAADPKASAAQFLALVGRAPSGQLQKEIKRLGIQGKETAGGENIVSATVARCFRASAIKNNSVPTITATNWVSYLLNWPGAIQAACPVDLARLHAWLVMNECNILSRTTHAILASRLSTPELSAQILQGVDYAKATQSPLNLSQAACLASCVFDLDAPLSHKATRLLALFDTVGTSCLPTDVLTAASSCLLQADPQDPAWKTPWFAPLILSMGVNQATQVFIKDTQSEQQQAQAQLREGILQLCSTHFLFDDQTLAEQADQASQSDEPQAKAHFFSALGALREKQGLDHATPPSLVRRLTHRM